jgi:hypothetical protein
LKTRHSRIRTGNAGIRQKSSALPRSHVAAARRSPPLSFLATGGRRRFRARDAGSTSGHSPQAAEQDRGLRTIGWSPSRVDRLTLPPPSAPLRVSPRKSWSGFSLRMR